MSEKRSLAWQRQAVEHLIAMCKSADETVIDAAKQACLSLAWFEKRADLTRELVRLDKEAPELASLLRQVPELRLDRVNFDDSGERDE